MYNNNHSPTIPSGPDGRGLWTTFRTGIGYLLYWWAASIQRGDGPGHAAHCLLLPIFVRRILFVRCARPISVHLLAFLRSTSTLICSNLIMFDLMRRSSSLWLLLLHPHFVMQFLQLLVFLGC